MAHSQGTIDTAMEGEDNHSHDVEFHLKNIHAVEGGLITFEFKVLGSEQQVTWFKNGEVIPRCPRFNVSDEGLWHKLLIKSVQRVDDGIYTAICRTQSGYAVSQATLVVTPKRFTASRDHSRNAIYLSWPKTKIQITKHLQNLRILKGDQIKLTVQIKKTLNIKPEFIWYKTNRAITFHNGTQIIGNDYDISELVKYNADVRDSGFYMVLIAYEDMVVSSSAEVVVLDPDFLPPGPLDIGGFIQYLPDELEVCENDEVSLICKADIDINTTIQWMKNGKYLQTDRNITFGNIGGRGVAIQIGKVSLDDRGLYTAILQNEKSGTEVSSECLLFVHPAPNQIPIAVVEKPLNVVLTSIGTKVCFYCKFKVPESQIFFAVWRIGLFKVERSTSQFQIVCNKLGMYGLVINNVDPDMLGEVSCQLQYLLPSKRSVQVAITKGLLVHIPPVALSEETFGEYEIRSEKIYADYEFEKSVVLYTAAQDLQPDCSDDEECRIGEASARNPQETATDVRLMPQYQYSQVQENDNEFVMEIVYCRLEAEYCNFLMVHSSRRRRVTITAKTLQEIPEEVQNLEPHNNSDKEYTIIQWNNDGEPPLGTLYAIDSAQPTGEYCRVGLTSQPKFTIVSTRGNSTQLLQYRVTVVKTAAIDTEDSLLLCLPKPNSITKQTVQHLPLEEFGKSFSRIGEPMGNGAYGAVYLVRNNSGNLFAAKVMKTRTEKRREAARREVEVMKLLHHHRIVQLHVTYHSRDQNILVMEYLWGGELFERIIEEDNFKERTAVHYVHQICEGLEYLHRQRIVHLDVKPENVVCISRNSRDIKIVDFGLSRVLQKSMVRAIYGTRDYIAPEVLNFEAIKPASDMWSLGVVTYVMLSGTIPFSGASWPERAVNITKGAYNFDDPAFDTVTAAAKDFINALLLLEPNDRMTAITARQHPWMVKKPAHELGIGQTKRWRSNLKTYLETNKARWQRAGNVVIAANRLLIGAHREGNSRLSDI